MRSGIIFVVRVIEINISVTDDPTGVFVGNNILSLFKFFGKFSYPGKKRIGDSMDLIGGSVPVDDLPIDPPLCRGKIDALRPAGIIPSYRKPEWVPPIILN